MPNTLDTLADVLATLAARNVTCDIFGGWAEEILGLRPPWQHRDIDLVYRAEDFLQLDLAIADLAGVFHIVAAKHFHHKRAFIFRDTLCEIVLVDSDENGPVTYFWGDVAYCWEQPLLDAETAFVGDGQFRVVSRQNLIKYRRDKRLRQPNRWRELVDRDR